MGPAAAVIAGSWFMTREVELSTTRAALVTLLNDDSAEASVQWRLPASKSDQQALGVARTHGCACGGAVNTGCPFHAIKSQLLRLRRLFPLRWSGTAFDVDLSLFPDVEGQAVTKEAMTATLIEAAKRLNVPISTADDSARISGHSLRRTGAQGLARLGVDSWAVQLLGRWGSNAVLEYIQEVPLERSAAWARAAARGTLPPSASSSTSSLGPPGAAAQQDAESPGMPSISLEAVKVLANAAKADEQTEKDTSTEANFVKSSGNIWHKVPAHGAVGPMTSWTTVCGWRFARSDGIVQSTLPQPLLHKFVCKRCLPAEHQAAKERC